MARKTAAAPSQFDFDVICIGSGSAGGSAAVLAARKGLKVALIEGGGLGGESPSQSSIPMHACLQAVRDLAGCRNAGGSGIEVGRIHSGWEGVMAFKRRCVEKTGVLKSAAAFEKAGIQIFKGFAQFSDPWTVRVDRAYVTGRQIIVASGADDRLPAIEGLDKLEYLNYRQALELPELPSSVFIVGGGATGCSLAEIFNGLGSRVYLAEAAANLLAARGRRGRPGRGRDPQEQGRPRLRRQRNQENNAESQLPAGDRRPRGGPEEKHRRRPDRPRRRQKPPDRPEPGGSRRQL